jgi:hypothetical protein
MELSFDCEKNTEASYLAQELELVLRKHGVPAEAISLKQSSTENMDVGSLLSISMATLNQLWGPVGSIATLASFIMQIMVKHHRDVIVNHDEGKVKIPVSKVSLPRVKAALTKAKRPNARAKPKIKSI